MFFRNRAKSCQLKTINVSSGTAYLECPTTEEKGEPFVAEVGGDWASQDARAVQKVLELTGNAACTGCRFYGKTPAEVDELRGREASAKAVRMYGENDLLRAQIERDELMSKIGKKAAAELSAPQPTAAVDAAAPPPAILPPEAQPPMPI